MADNFTETLEQIFQMMEPADFVGNKKVSLGKKASDSNVVNDINDIIYNAGGRGARPIEKMVTDIDSALAKASEDDVTSYKSTIHIFNSKNAHVKEENKSEAMSVGRDGSKVEDKITFRELIGRELSNDKTMAIIKTSSPYMTPAVLNAERCEIFLNSIPSIHASRMVPILQVEFSFNRIADEKSAQHESFGLTRFMLGSDKIKEGSATEKLVQGRTIQNSSIETTTVGMEIFTSPQTLVPLNSAASVVGRYANVIDPMRPPASIESFVVNVTPTVGMYSYKKGTLTFKLHDRSRLAEIADLIRPQIYQNAATAPTVWITYGWRYPYEPASQAGTNGSRSYSDFINNNMLVREAYGIANSQFSFDQLGQVTVSLELWTKGVNELRTTRITDTNDGMSKVLKDLTDISERISKYATALNFGKADGVSREIRAFQIIESAERGVYPDMSAPEIQEAISKLKKSMLKANPDSESAKNLLKALEEFYKPSKDKKNFDLKQQVKQKATEIAKTKFNEVTQGKDPFLFFNDKNEKYKNETKSNADHPFTKLIDLYNKNTSENKNIKEFNKRLVSLGKLISVFVAHAIENVESIDELQLFFHQFNDSAGMAAGTNIAEFPIDMPVFFDQYRQTIEQKGSERLTLEEFLKLVIDAQVLDERAVGYGFREFFEPYDSENPSDAKLKKDQQGAYEAAISGLGKQRGAFVKPTIEIYVETTYASDGAGNDLLHRFELQDAGATVETTQTNHLTKIMRIHIFDRQTLPYKTQSVILKGEGTATYETVRGDYAKNHTEDGKKNAIAQLLRGVDVDKDKVQLSYDLLDADNGGPYESIKKIISKTMPSIIYGSNASMIVNANLATKQDPLLSVSQMQTIAKKSGKPSVGQPNGGGAGGLPLRVIPAQLTLSTLGCPLLTYGQLFFVDFNTGTTVDNIYGITGLTHTIMPGKFETQIKMTYYDAYGRYEGAPTKLDYVKSQLTTIADKKK